MLRTVIVCVLTITLPWTTFPLAVSSPDTPATGSLAYEETIERLTRMFDLLEELRSHIDRSQFDLNVLLEQLDYDAEQIIDFSKKEIAFEQYSGLLRGAEGTLVSRAGNALDLSVLTAKLLRDAGYDARIARGSLDDEQARTLLEEMTAPRTPGAPVGDVDAMLTLIRASSTDLGIDLTPLAEALQKPAENDNTYTSSAHEHQSYLLKVLADAKVSLGHQSTSREILDEAKDYFWVQYRLGPSEPWTNTHPAFRSSPFPDQIAVSEVFEDVIPQNLQHRFQLEVVMEQALGGKIASKSIMPPWDRPLANLVGTELTYQTVSRHLLAQYRNGEKLSAPTNGVDILLPSLDGRVVGDGFDLLGNYIDADAAGSAFAPFFATVSRQASKALSAIADLGLEEDAGKSDQVRLQSLRLKMTLFAPGDTRTIHWRSLYEFAPGAQEGAQWSEQFRDLTQTVHLGFVVGASNAAHTLDLTLRAISNQRQAVKLLPMVLSGKRISEAEAAILQELNTGWHGTHLMPSVFDSMPNDDASVLAYRPAPMLVTHSQTMPIAGSIKESVDIVQNPRRAINVDNLSFNPEYAVLLGAWETATEGVLIRIPGVPTISTLSLFADANRRGIPIRVLNRSTIDTLPSFSIPAPARSRIREEIDRGFVVISPSQSYSEDSDVHGWWRIDPRTGTTLGMVVDGHRYGGVELTERQKFFIFATLAIATITSILETVDCIQDESATKLDCACAATLGTMGFAGGIVVFSSADNLGIGLGFVGALLGLVCLFISWEEAEP